MKNSKVFLGITTALLAIAGVAAAKAHRSPVTTAYYKASDAGATLSVAYRVNSVASGGILYTISGRQVYTDITLLTKAYYHSN